MVFVPVAGGAQQSDLIPELRELVRTGMAEDQIPGAIVSLVFSDGTSWVEGFGVADLETGRPVDPATTLFRVGSVTKVLTALGVLRLLDEGDLERQALVRKLVDLPVLDDSQVTVDHLLSHTGGFDQTGLGRHADSPRVRPPLDEFLREQLLPVRPPGRVATYDTYGITLAGHLIEVVSGLSYGDFMRRRVFEAIGMTSSWVEAPESVRGDLAVGYGLQNGEHVAQEYEWYTTLPASSVESTAHDMELLLRALTGDGSVDGHRLLSSEALRDVRRRAQSGMPFVDGWWSQVARGEHVLTHGGVMAGYSSELVWVPRLGVAMFIAYNRDPETGPIPKLRDRAKSKFLRSVLPRKSESAASSSVIEASEVAGWWVSTGGCLSCDGEGWLPDFFEIEEVESKVLRFRGVLFQSTADGVFRQLSGPHELRFVREGNGTIRFMNDGQDGYERFTLELIERVERAMGPGSVAGTLRSRWDMLRGDENRDALMEELRNTPPEVPLLGTYWIDPPRGGSEPMRVVLSRSGREPEGFFQPRSDRPRRPVVAAAVGGRTAWIIVEVPGGVLEFRLHLAEGGDRFEGTLAEGLEVSKVVGRFEPTTGTGES